MNAASGSPWWACLLSREEDRTRGWEDEYPEDEYPEDEYPEDDGNYWSFGEDGYWSLGKGESFEKAFQNLLDEHQKTVDQEYEYGKAVIESLKPEEARDEKA